MNLDECKRTVQNALDDLGHRKESPVAVFLAMGKLQAALESWPVADAETARLMKFEHDARAVLSGGYGIEKATWNGPDGKPVMLRILDEENVLRVLKS